jgi:hypothetical protein
LKKLPVILFFLGILIQLAALLGEHAEEIPFVIRIIAPSYYHANQGLKILEDKGSLDKDSEGYGTISKILIELSASGLYLKKATPGIFFEETNTLSESDLANLSISNLNMIHGNFASTRNGKYIFDGVSYELLSKAGPFNYDPSSQESPKYEMDCRQPEEDLRDRIEQLKRIPILEYCFGMFFIGTIFEVVAFIIEYKESRKNGQRE